MRRLGLWLLYLLPLGYAGMIFAVTVHEVLGHGVFALVLGGTFVGFNVHLDGMGSAFANAPGHPVGMYAGGIVAEVVLGFLLVGASLLARRRPLVRAALIVLAMNLFLDGLPYGFWDAVFEGTIGDVGAILSIEAWQPLRTILLLGLGLLYAGTTALTSCLLFRTVEDDQGPLSLGLACVVAGALFGGVTLGFATFDWEQLIPGAGITPTLGTAALQLAVGVWLVLTRRREVEPVRVTRREWRIGIPLAWLVAAATVAVVVIWLSNGLYWG